MGVDKVYSIYSKDSYICTKLNQMTKKKNEGLRSKLIHLTEDTVVKLTVKASKQKPRITAKEYIQNLCIKAAK